MQQDYLKHMRLTINMAEMTNTEILTKAISKAVENGFDFKWDIEPTAEFIIRTDNYQRLIFSHEFAKALGYKVAELGAWVDDGFNPIKYLEKHIK